MKYFPTTNWTVISEAGRTSGERSRFAVEKLCSTYWYPLYVYARSSGDSPHDAEDSVQTFFVEFLEKNLPAKARREKGRFRSFLLGSFELSRAKQREKLAAFKRGGRAQSVSIDLLEAEDRYSVSAQEVRTPAHHFEREWAIAVLGEAHRRLAEKYAAAGKERVFTGLKNVLQLEGRPDYRTLASKLGKTEASTKMEVSRMRSQYRQLLREVVAETVSDMCDLDEELGHLLSVLCS